MKYTHLVLLSSVVAVSVVSAAELATVEVSVSAAGAVALDGKAVTMDELARALQAVAAKEKKPDLLIIAAEDAPIQVLSAVMDLCRKSGFTKFSLQSA